MTPTILSIRRWLPRLLLGAGLATLAMLALAVIFIAVPLTRWVLIVALAQWMLGGRLESLAVDLDLQPNLRWIFTLLIVLPVGFGLARAVMARTCSSALRGLALAAGTLLLLAIAVWWNTRHFNFDAKGRPVLYLSFRRDGAHKSYSPGIDRVTGRAKYQATIDRVAWLSDLARQPVRPVDPALETNWFDANSGEPNLWYVEVGTHEWQFFNRPHFHQHLRVEVLPITPEVMARWQAEHERQVAEGEALQRRREAEAKATAERERQRQESAQREHEAALARAQQEEARRHAEQDAREAAAEVARRQRLQEAAEALRHQAVLERRAREATAKFTDLDWLQPAELIIKICPGLNVESFRAQAFEEDVAGRRFRISGRLSVMQPAAQEASFEAVTIGRLHVVIQATFRSDAFTRVRLDRPITIAGTVATLRFVNGVTNIHGLDGQICLIQLGDAVVFTNDTPISQVASSATLSQSRSVATSVWATPKPVSGPVAYASTPQPLYHYATPPSFVLPPPPSAVWVPYGCGTPRVSFPRFQPGACYQRYSYGPATRIFVSPSVSGRYSYGYHPHR
ncbi:MAG: cell envelope integrity protein TolA [Verrucomicrobiota bacterium]